MVLEDALSRATRRSVQRERWIARLREVCDQLREHALDRVDLAEVALSNFSADYSSSDAMIRWFSVSLAEPDAICRYRMVSLR